MSTHKNLVVEVATATPSAAALFVTWVLGLTVEKWLAVASIAFIGLQAAYMIWRWVKEARKRGDK